MHSLQHLNRACQAIRLAVKIFEPGVSAETPGLSVWAAAPNGFFSNTLPDYVNTHLIIFDFYVIMLLNGGGALEIIKQRIRALRESVGLSQNKLGKLVGLPQSSINRYEQGQSTPSAKTLRWYADYFDVSMDYIYGRTDDPHGAYYECKAKYVKIDPKMKEFVEMCFEPGSNMNERLKGTLLQMLAEEEAKK